MNIINNKIKKVLFLFYLPEISIPCNEITAITLSSILEYLTKHIFLLFSAGKNLIIIMDYIGIISIF